MRNWYSCERCFRKSLRRIPDDYQSFAIKLVNLKRQSEKISKGIKYLSSLLDEEYSENALPNDAKQSGYNFSEQLFSDFKKAESLSVGSIERKNAMIEAIKKEIRQLMAIGERIKKVNWL